MTGSSPTTRWKLRCEARDEAAHAPPDPKASHGAARLTGSRKPSLKTVLKNLLFIIQSKRIAAERAEELPMHAIECPMFSERGVFHARIAFNLGLHQTIGRSDVARGWFDKARAAATAQQAADLIEKIEAATAALRD